MLHIFAKKNITVSSHRQSSQIQIIRVMYFFTATINSWKLLLNDEELKKIIIKSLLFFHENERAIVCGFVIMPNHIHLLWEPLGEFNESENEFALLSYTAH